MKKQIIISLLIFIFVKVDAQLTTRQHPEKGILPFNAPCKSCTEEIEKRTGSTREFFALNDDGSKTIYMQKSLGNMNFKDKEGFWRTKDPRVLPEGSKLFAARMQPSPVVIDFENKFASINNGGNELRFNKNISLVHIASDGTSTPLGEGNWSHFSRSENYTETIFLIQDFYPGVDLQMITCYGRIKTNFILKNRLQFTDGWLGIRQQLEVPSDLHVDLSQSVLSGDGKRNGIISIENGEGENYFIFKKSFCYDAKERTENFTEMPFMLNGNRLDYFVSVDWLNNPQAVYPVTLDPLVYSSDTLYQAGILGSGFTTVCGTQGCSYFLDSVMTPANCEITGIATYFSYMCILPCIRDDGGFDITMTNPAGTSCTSRNFTCLGGIQGACFFWPAQLLHAVPPLSQCVPPPQCTPYPLNFELKFRRCNWVPVIPCDASCVQANSDWIMTIEGRTVGISSITCSAAASQICEGGSTVLSADTIGGVGPYIYSWQPGNLSGQSVTVSPDSTTQYFLTVTDNCGATDNASITVYVIPKQNPGFTIAPGDTVCDSTGITLTANGTAPATCYDWVINCPSIASFFDQQILNYVTPSVASNCTATLRYQVVSGAMTCNFDSTQNFVVDLCSGINEFNADDPVKAIYPNPANDHITIQFSGSVDAKDIFISNVLGEEILEKRNVVSNKIDLDVSVLQKGIYLLKVSIRNQFSIHKVILY